MTCKFIISFVFFQFDVPLDNPDLFREHFVGHVMDEVPVIGVSGASSRLVKLIFSIFLSVLLHLFHLLSVFFFNSLHKTQFVINLEIFLSFQPSQGSSFRIHVSARAQVVPPPLHHSQRLAAQRYRLPLHQPGTRGWNSPNSNVRDPCNQLDFKNWRRPRSSTSRRSGTLCSLVATQHLSADDSFCKAADGVSGFSCKLLAYNF